MKKILAAAAVVAWAGCTCGGTKRDPVVVAAPSNVTCDVGGDGRNDPVVEVADAAGLVAAVNDGALSIFVTGDIDEAVTLDDVAGTDDAPVILNFGGHRVTAPVVINGAEHVVVRSGVFISDGTYSWLNGRDVSDLAIIDSAFDVSCFLCGDAFTGIDLERGRDLRMCGNAFGSWIGDEVWLRDIERMLVDQNDFGRAQGEHAIFSYLGSDLVVRDNVFRNPWDRVLHVASLEPAIVTRRAVIEHNVFLDSDWDSVRFRPIDDTYIDGAGAFEAIRLLGNDHIFRGNLVVGTQKGNQGDCHGGLVLTTFSTELWSIEQVQGNRIYNNVFVDNDAVSVGVLDHLELGLIKDNIVAQNVFADSVDAAVGLCSPRRRVDELTVRDNVFGRGDGDAIVTVDGVADTVDVTDDDDGFAANVEADVVFADRGAVDAVIADEALSLDQLDPLFAALQVNDAPAAPPLAHLLERQDDRNFIVDDASFFSDGHGVVDGDVVIVGDDVASQVLAQIERIDGDHIAFTAALPPFVAGTGLRWAATPGAPLLRPALPE